jgi:hypothetical protein
MKLVTKEIKKLLDSNNNKEPEQRVPYLKLFNPCGPATWLITEFNEGEGMFFGICDLGFGFPELGYVSLEEIESVDLPFGMKIERDMYWSPEGNIMQYLTKAKEKGEICNL